MLRQLHLLLIISLLVMLVWSDYNDTEKDLTRIEIYPSCKYIRGKCYRLFEITKGFFEAEAYCVANNGHLATILDRYVQNELAKSNKGIHNAIWIGLVKLKCHSYPGFDYEWNWIYGTSAYRDWYDSYPDKANPLECCAVMARRNSYYKWTPLTCSYRNYFWCVN